MSDTIGFADLPLWLILLLSLASIVAAIELGRRAGLRARADGKNSIATLEGAVLGLLALMISFTFAMSLARYDARRDAILNEANAIGTTALRARLLPEPQATASLRLLREYVELRVSIAMREVPREELSRIFARSSDIQERLWQQAKAAAAHDNAMVPTGIYIQTLNEMIDSQSKRRTAAQNRVPDIVLLALYATTIVAGAFAGYGTGVEARGSRLPVHALGILLVSMILLIQDLDRPGAGFIKVSHRPMFDAAASIAGYLK